MLILPQSHPIVVAASGITFVGSAVSQDSASVTMPSGFAANDLVVVTQYTRGTAPTAAFPPDVNYTSVLFGEMASGVRSMQVSACIIDGSSSNQTPGSAVTGTAGSSQTDTQILGFRKPGGFSTLTVAGTQFDTSAGAPSSLTLNCSLHTAPVIAIAGVGRKYDAAGTPTFASLSPTPDAEVEGYKKFRTAYYIWDSGPQSITNNQDDQGDNNSAWIVSLEMT